MNVSALAAALAARYSAANTTAPAGFDPIHESTHLLPTAVTSTPTVLVFPPAATLEAAPGGPIRFSELPFPVRVLIGQESDRPHTMAAAYAWLDALLDQPLGDINLGFNTTTDCFATGFRIGEYRYSEQDYITVEFEVRVRVVEPITVTP